MSASRGSASASRSRSRSRSFHTSEERSRSRSGSRSGSGSGSGSASDDDDDDGETSDFEGHSGYKKGGYHPVRIGDVYHGGRYTIEKKLGWGHFSTVWLASDATKPNDHPAKLVALKVQKSAIQYTEAANDEIKLLSEIEERYRAWKEENDAHAQQLDASVSSSAFAVETAHTSNTYIVHLLDHFTLEGPHGKHVCLVFERAGRNLLHVIKKYNYAGVPIRLVKSMVKQILAGFRFLHDECGIIHTDLKPENVLCGPPPLDPVVVARERDEMVAARLTKEEAKKMEMKRAEIEALRLSMQKINLAPTAPAKLSKNQKKRAKKKAKLQAAKQAAGGGGSNAGEAKDAGEDDDDEEEDDEDAEKEDGEKVEEKTEAAAAAAAPAEVAASTTDKSSDAPAAPSTAAAPADSAAAPAALATSISEVDYLSQMIDSFLSGQTPEFHTKIADLGNGCLPEHDTRVLTSEGFLFLAEIEALVAAGRPPLYACYDASAQSLVYCPGRPVLVPPPEHWVDFTQAATRRLWDSTSDDYGGSVAAAKGEIDDANRLTLRTTPEHDMFVQLCEAESQDDGVCPRIGAHAPIPPHKMLAAELAPGFECACRDTAGVTCTHGYSHYRVYTGAAEGLQPHKSMLAVGDTDAASPVAALGLHTADELDAFLEVYGYWLGDSTGTMSYDTQAVCFMAREQHDRAYLRALLARLPLRREEDYTEDESDRLLTVRVEDQRWCRFFDATSGHFDQRADSVASVKWLADWARRRLDKRQLRLLIEGVRQAAGSSSADTGDVKAGVHMISTSSVAFREQLVVACLHAGYSAYFEVHTRTCQEIPPANDDDSWWVCYSDAVSEVLPATDVRFDGRACRIRSSQTGEAAADPEAFTEVPTLAGDRYDQKRDGRVWCVQVQHDDHLIVAQRAHRASSGVVTKVGRATVTGNCWIDKHFTDDVTTRQYRAPEVLVGYPYSCPIDVWSTACLAFEMVTGDYLFDPQEDPQAKFSRDEDHLALMSELLGRMPKKLTTQGKYSKEMFTKRGDLKHIKELDRWGLQEVLLEKYKLAPNEARMFASFLLPMLALDPDRRITAAEAVEHPWLHVHTDEEYQAIIRAEEAAAEAAREHAKAGGKKKRRLIKKSHQFADRTQPAGASTVSATADPEEEEDGDDPADDSLVNSSLESLEPDDLGVDSQADDGEDDDADEDEEGEGVGDDEGLPDDLDASGALDASYAEEDDDDADLDDMDHAHGPTAHGESGVDEYGNLVYRTATGFTIQIPDSLAHREDLQFLFAQATERALSGDERFAAFLDPTIGAAAVAEAARAEELDAAELGEEADFEDELDDEDDEDEPHSHDDLAPEDALLDSSLEADALHPSGEYSVANEAAAALRRSQMRYLAELRLRSQQQDVRDAKLSAAIAARQAAGRDADADEDDEGLDASAGGADDSASAAHAALHPHDVASHHHHNSGHHAPGRSVTHSIHELVHHHKEQTQAQAKAGGSARAQRPVHGAHASTSDDADVDDSPHLDDDDSLGEEEHALALALNRHSHAEPFVSASAVLAAHQNAVDATRAATVAASQTVDLKQLGQAIKQATPVMASSASSAAASAGSAAAPLDDDDAELLKAEEAANAEQA